MIEFAYLYWQIVQNVVGLEMSLHFRSLFSSVVLFKNANVYFSSSSLICSLFSLLQCFAPHNHRNPYQQNKRLLIHKSEDVLVFFHCEFCTYLTHTCVLLIYASMIFCLFMKGSLLCYYCFHCVLHVCHNAV